MLYPTLGNPSSVSFPIRGSCCRPAITISNSPGCLSAIGAKCSTYIYLHVVYIIHISQASGHMQPVFSETLNDTNWTCRRSTTAVSPRSRKSEQIPQTFDQKLQGPASFNLRQHYPFRAPPIAAFPSRRAMRLNCSHMTSCQHWSMGDDRVHTYMYPRVHTLLYLHRHLFSLLALGTTLAFLG